MTGSEGAWLIVLAAGSGERLGFDRPKAFVPLAGRPMLQWSIAAAAGATSVSGVVVAVPPAMLAEARRMVGDDVAAVVEGGPDRQASVRSGLVAVPPSATVVVCHDAARPLVTAELVDRVVAKVAGRAEAAVPVVPSADTVKRIRSGEVIETVPRDEVGLAQTPQAFVAGVLREAHARALRDGLEATDDAMLLEAYGHTVAVVDGLAANFKITGPEDLERAERILAATSGRAVGTPGG